MKAKLNASHVERVNFRKQLVKRNARNAVRAVTVPKKRLGLVMVGLHHVLKGATIPKKGRVIRKPAFYVLKVSKYGE